jgi:hypothetical protein
MSRHLATCSEWQLALTQATKGKAHSVTVYHLQVQDAWSGDFWLQLEMLGWEKLEKLDDYLRAIWLECCGHLSGFTIGEVFYTQMFEDGMGWREERSMDVPVGDIFSPGMTIPYEYDFGTTSELTIQVVRERKGKWEGHPIKLMARNKLMDLACGNCGKPAEFLCTDCMWGEDDPLYCENCLSQHEHGDEMALPVVNSPRMGMCAYSGPAEPPY